MCRSPELVAKRGKAAYQGATHQIPRYTTEGSKSMILLKGVFVTELLRASSYCKEMIKPVPVLPHTKVNLQADCCPVFAKLSLLKLDFP